MKKTVVIFTLVLGFHLCFSQNSKAVLGFSCVDGKLGITENMTAAPGGKVDMMRNGCITETVKVIFDGTSYDFPANRNSLTISLPVEKKGDLEVRIEFPDMSSKTFKVRWKLGENKETITWNTFQDALQLSELWKKQDFDKMNRILENYQIDNSDNIQYLVKYSKSIKSLPKPAGTEKNSDINFPEQKTTPASNIPGIFSPTLIIDGLSKFAAKRFKEELTIAFLQRFRDTLMSDQFTELRMLFPRTFHTLVTADVFSYAQYFQSLHENAQTDLYNLPENAGALVRKNKSGITPEYYPAILASLDLMRVLELKLPASTAVEYLAYRDYVDLSADTKYAKISRLMGIFSKNLHSWDENTPTGWADEKYLARLITDEDAFNFWMALVLKREKAELEKIDTGSSNLFVLLNGLAYEKQMYLRECFARFLEVQATSRQLASMAGAKDSLTKAETFTNYSLATFNLLLTGVQLVGQVSGNVDDPTYDRIVHLLKAGQSMALFAHKKRFGDALSVTLEVLKLLYFDSDLPPSLSKSETDANKISRAKLFNILDKYGNLLVSCANAQNSDQLLAILERAAAPVQSYRKKRGAGHWSAAINMYPGIAVGYEYQIDDANGFGPGGTIVGFTTPVGFSLTRGIGKKSSISLFASLIDIGAVTAFRLGDNDSLLPELEWKNVFAPGGYLMFGLGRTPLTFGVGGQYGPALRKVTKENADIVERSHFRVGVSLTVDVPVLMVSLGAGKKYKSR